MKSVSSRCAKTLKKKTRKKLPLISTRRAIYFSRQRAIIVYGVIYTNLCAIAHCMKRDGALTTSVAGPREVTSLQKNAKKKEEISNTRRPSRIN